jgi:hypothetical protein
MTRRKPTETVEERREILRARDVKRAAKEAAEKATPEPPKQSEQ